VFYSYCKFTDESDSANVENKISQYLMKLYSNNVHFMDYVLDKQTYYI